MKFRACEEETGGLYQKMIELKEAVIKQWASNTKDKKKVVIWNYFGSSIIEHCSLLAHHDTVCIS